MPREKTIDSIKFWQPHVPYLNPKKKIKNKSLRIAAIVDDRLYQGLRFECTLLLLTPDNFKYTILYGKPDIVLVESCFLSVTGDWHHVQRNISMMQDSVIELINLAKKKNIPTVFWITQDVTYINYFQKMASCFDHIFCSDIRSVYALNKHNIQSLYLPPAIQPAIYNPFRQYDCASATSLGLLYDGIHDVEQYSEKLSILNRIQKYGLSLIESRYELVDKRINISSKLEKNILGCVSFNARAMALKYAEACLMMSITSATETTQQWMALECVACRTPVLHLGQISDDDIRKGIVNEFEDELDILTEIFRFKEDDLYREEIAHLGWRKVNSKHTFSQRLEVICEETGVTANFNNLRPVSAIFASDREEYLLDCIDTFRSQTYQDKEMIIVYNGPKLSSEIEEKINDNNHKLIELTIAPEEITLGMAINMGVSRVKGEYCFKMDDDDLYGPNYITDMMLYTNAIDADLLGKSQSRYTYFESDDSYWSNNNNRRIPLCVIPQNHEKYPEKMYVSGNTICATTKIMKEFPWDQTTPKGSDTKFLASINREITIVTVDRFNMAVVRRNNNSHTWKISENVLRKNSVKIVNGKEIPCYII